MSSIAQKQAHTSSTNTEVMSGPVSLPLSENEQAFILADHLLLSLDTQAEWLSAYRQLCQQKSQCLGIRIARALCKAIILQEPMAAPYRAAYRANDATLLMGVAQ